MKCIDDEIPFEIPQGWEWCRLGAVLEVSSARRVHEKDWRASGVPFYRAREIGKLADYGYVDNDLFIDKSLYDDFAKSGIPRVGDLMMTAVGTLGKTYVVTDESPFYYKDGSVLCIGNPHCLNPFFIKYYFESSIFSNQYVTESDGTTVATLTMVRLNRYFIPIPPLLEQQRIVDIIKKLAPYITKYEETQSKLNILNNSVAEKLKKSILQDAIQGRLVPQIAEEGTAQELLAQIQQEKARLVKEGKLKKKDITDSVIFKGDDNKYYERINGSLLDISDEVPFDLPETWAWCRFSTIVNYRIGKTPARGETAYWHPASIPWVSISDMKEYGLVQNTKERISNEASKVFGAIVPKGTLLMSFKLTVGRTAFLDINAFHNEAIISIFPYAAPEVMKHYLFYTLPLLANMGDSKDAIKGKTLNSNSINNLLIPVPPVATQEAIINKIQEAFSNL